MKRANLTISFSSFSFQDGPEMVELKRIDPTANELQAIFCPDGSKDVITMECSADSVYPGATFDKISMEKPGSTIRQDDCNKNASKKCTYTFSPKGGGQHTFRCQTMNTAFGDIKKTSDAVSVYVKG